MHKDIPQDYASSFFWHIVDMNIAAISMWDMDGSIIMVNDHFLNLLGYTREEFEKDGLSWKEITVEEAKHLDEKSIQELRYHMVSKPYVKKYRKKDGSALEIRIHNAVANHTDTKGIALIIPLQTD